jgi:hypothetical protein
MSPMRALIIGTSGQLATELHRQAGGLPLHPAQKVDVADEPAIRALLDAARPTLVINASAYTAVDRAEQERERAFAVNASGPRYLARWCAANGAALIHVSTDYVFNGAKASSYVEEDAVDPLNVYGESKLAGEIAIREELPQHLILRTSWVFSAHGQNFVKTMRRLAAERDELRVIADQHGRPTSAADLAVWSRPHDLGDVSLGQRGPNHVARLRRSDCRARGTPRVSAPRGARDPRDGIPHPCEATSQLGARHQPLRKHLWLWIAAISARAARGDGSAPSALEALKAWRPRSLESRRASCNEAQGKCPTF